MIKINKSNGDYRLIALILSVLFFSFVIPSFSAFAQAPGTTVKASAEKATSTEKTSSTVIDKTTQARQYMELINSVFSFVMQNYVDEVDPDVLYQGAMTGLMNAMGDPHTVYLTASDMANLSDTTVGNFGGVGLSITKAVQSTMGHPAYVEVASPVEGGPGWKVGVHSGDMIISINGESTPALSMEEVLAKLRGEIGTSVDIVVKRGKTMELSFTIVRELIEVPTVKYDLIGRTGYLRIIEFTPQTAERVQQALDSFKTAGYTSLILDLRDNPGGLITSAVDVADKFIDSGAIVSTKSRLPYDNSVYTASSKNTVVPSDMPIIVLINRGSASASEIVSGALKDNHLAYLVGEKTYGKGSVQQPVPLPYSDGIKLTIARYYTPSDSNIDKIGIPPDHEVLFPSFTEDEEKAYVALIESSVIENYVDDHQQMTEKDISNFSNDLKKTYNLEPRVLRRLVRLEVYRTRNPLLYDLDFDLQLQEALAIIDKGNYTELVAATKTLKELQEEAQAKAEAISLAENGSEYDKEVEPAQ